MNQAAFVNVPKREGRLKNHQARVGHGERSLAEDGLRQVFTRNVLGGQVQLLADLSGIERLDDVRVVQVRGESNFAKEADSLRLAPRNST